MLLAAVLAVPVILLCGLFLRQSWRDISFVNRELKGAEYLAALWPLYEQAAAGAPEDPGARRRFEQARARLDPVLGTAGVSGAFDGAAPPDERVERGQMLIRTVADRSNLMLDPELDSFYLADAVADRLPELMKAAADLGRAEAISGAPLARAARMGSAWDRVQANAGAAEASLDAAMEANDAGDTRRVLGAETSTLKIELDDMTAQAAAASEGVSPGTLRLQGLQQRLQHRVSETWRISLSELTRLLKARRLRMLTAIWTSLAMVLLSLGVSAVIGWAIVYGLDVRARGLLSAIRRLVEGDVSVAIPYRHEPGEIGRIAGGVQALKLATEERVRLAAELERVNRELRDQRSWLRLAHEAGRMGAWRRPLPGDRLEISPELAQLLGFPPDAPPQLLRELEPLLPDPDLLKRFAEEQGSLDRGELDPTLTEVLVPARRRDTGEIRWFMLRRELVGDSQDRTLQSVGVAIDITDRKHMMDELNHRVKNNLATVLSLAAQTAKSTGDIRQFVKLFTGRLQALAKVNELLTRHAWAEVRVWDVVTTALGPWLGAGVEVRDDSPFDLVMSARAAVSLCLVVHELAISAERRGSLAIDGGKVEVAWSRPDPAHGVLTWMEDRPERPPAPGEGDETSTRMIERLVSGDLGGRADFDVSPVGLRARISFALAGTTR